MNGNSKAFIILFCWFWSFFGCDDSPSYDVAITTRAIQQPRSWTSEKGRGGYEWKLNPQGQFVISIPPTFPFLSELASQPKQTSLWPAKSASNEPWHRPGWMSDEVHRFFRRFTEPASQEILLQLPANQISHALAFDLNRNGKTLVTLSDGKIELYDLHSPSPPQSFPCPLKDAYGILSTNSQNRFYVCNSKSVALIDVTDTTMLTKNLELSFAITTWEKAAESDALLAVTADNKMSLVDGELNLIDTTSALEDSNVLGACLKFDGEYVLASLPSAIFYWTPGNLKSTFIQKFPQSSVLDETTRPYRRVVTGRHFDCHWDAMSLNLIGKSSAESGTDMLSISSTPHHLAELHIRSFESSQGSFLAHAKQKVADGSSSEYLVFDFATPIASNYIGKNGRFRHSIPVSIVSEPIKRMLTDRTGQTVVMFGQSGLSALKRTPWMGPPDANLCYELAKTLLASDDFVQMERCAQELRQQDWPEHGLWGEQVYACFVQQVGRATGESKLDTSKQERLSSWLETGSDLAILSRAFHPDYSHHWGDMRRFAEGAGMDSLTLHPESISASLESFETRVNQVLEHPHPPAIAFWIKYYFLQLRSKSISEIEPILKRCIELYPSQLDIHKYAVVRILSGSAPNSLPAQAYVKAIANSFSKELVDEATVWLMSELSPDQWRYIFASDAWQKEQEQIERTVTNWIRDGEQNKIETFFQRQPELKTSLKKTGIDQYDERTFLFGF